MPTLKTIRHYQLKKNTYNFYFVIEVLDRVYVFYAYRLYFADKDIYMIRYFYHKIEIIRVIASTDIFCSAPTPFSIPHPHMLISSTCQGYSFEKFPLPKHHVACYNIHVPVLEAMTSRCCGCNFSFSIHSA